MANMTPEVLDICRSRGDTFPFDLVITLNSVAVDITGNTFLLTVDPSPAPADALNNEFQNTPAIQDAPAGIIRVTLLAVGEADLTPSTYYYDLQMTSGSAVRTIAKGEWVVEQDITK